MTHANTRTTSSSEQASHWWVVLHSEDVSADDHRDFTEWVSGSPERVAAYLETARLMYAVRSPGISWPQTSADELVREAKASSPSVVELSSYRPEKRSDFGAAGPAASATPDGKRTKRLVPLSLAASFAVFGIAIALYLNRFAEYETGFGEQRSMLLEDGSRVTLNTSSRIAVDMRPDRRVIHLLKGEALFDVAHDVRRPFDVQSGRTTVRAVGTQFDVYMRAQTTTVTVVEGRVAVIADPRLDRLLSNLPAPGVPTPATVPDGLVILTPADRVVITKAGVTPTQHMLNGTAATSWTAHQLVFEHRPLSEVAEEFNRYNARRIEISSADLERQEVTGVFQYNDPKSFLEFLSKVPGVEIRQASDGHQVVSSRVAGSAQVR